MTLVCRAALASVRVWNGEEFFIYEAMCAKYACVSRGFVQGSLSPLGLVQITTTSRIALKNADLSQKAGGGLTEGNPLEEGGNEVKLRNKKSLLFISRTCSYLQVSV